MSLADLKKDVCLFEGHISQPIHVSKLHVHGKLIDSKVDVQAKQKDTPKE